MGDRKRKNENGRWNGFRVHTNISKYNNVDSDGSDGRSSDSNKNWRKSSDNNNNFGIDFGFDRNIKPEVNEGLLWPSYNWNGNSSSSKPTKSIFDQIVKESSDSDGQLDG